MAYQGPQTAKTYNRPTDRWPDDLDPSGGGLDLCQSQGFVGWYFGTTWNVMHRLKTMNLVITVWIDDSLVAVDASMYSVTQLSEDFISIVWNTGTPVRGKVVLYALCETNPMSDIIFEQNVAESIWIIPHNMGLSIPQLLASFWLNGERLDPIGVSVTETELSVEFPMATTGIACVVRVNPLRIKGRSSNVFIVETPELVWTFEHTLHTADLLCQIWIDKTGMSIQSIEVTDDTVEVTFSEPCIGSLCLMDPFPVQECLIHIRQIVDWPSQFPVGPHSHLKADILEAQNSDRLGGYPAAHYLQTPDLGIMVCPLEITVSGDRKVPKEFLPTGLGVTVLDADGVIEADQIKIDNASGLYLQKDYLNKTAIISKQFESRVLQFTGNVTPAVGQSTAQIITSPSANWILEFGEGIQAQVVSPQTVRILSPKSIAKIYTLIGVDRVLAGGNWVIDDALVLATPGSYVFTLYERNEAGNKQVVSVGDLPGQIRVESLVNRIIVWNDAGRDLIEPTVVIFGY